MINEEFLIYTLDAGASAYEFAKPVSRKRERACFVIGSVVLAGVAISLLLAWFFNR